jgi:hypothetical protein
VAYGGVNCYRVSKKLSAPVAQWIEQPPSKVIQSTYATVVSYKIFQTLYGTSGAVLTSIS